MKKYLIAISMFFVSLAALAYGEAGQWSSGWAQGVSEYAAVVSRGNEFYMACQSDKGVYMSVKVNGKEYGPDAKKGFNIEVNGKVLERPYVTDNMVGEQNFNYLLQQIQKGKQLKVITADGQTLVLPTKNEAKAIPKRNDCHSGF